VTRAGMSGRKRLSPDASAARGRDHAEDPLDHVEPALQPRWGRLFRHGLEGIGCGAGHPDVLILSDEIYEHILFDERTFLSFAAANPSLKDRTLTVNGVSKAYAMTGWRIGYGAGPKPLIAAMTKVQSQICSGACAIAQAAAAAALNGPQDDVRRFCAAFEERRDLVVDRIAKIDGLTLDPLDAPTLSVRKPKMARRCRMILKSQLTS